MQRENTDREMPLSRGPGSRSHIDRLRRQDRDQISAGFSRAETVALQLLLIARRCLAGNLSPGR